VFVSYFVLITELLPKGSFISFKKGPNNRQGKGMKLYESLAERSRGGERLVVREIEEEIDSSEQGQYEGGS
jgi:hypothetical protein